MSRALKIDIPNRDSYEVSASDNIPDWMGDFVKKMEAAENKTAVEVARERQVPIAEQIYAIMNGGKRSLYSSVQEAVEDYQKRTGLFEYRKLCEASQALAFANEIIAAGEDETEKKNLLPKLIEQNPAVDSYIHNLIDTNKGIQLPAVLFSILETFGRSLGLSERDIDDPDLAKHVNEILKQKRMPKYDNNNASLGRGVGTQNENYDMYDGNRDPFAGLSPRRMY